MTATIKDVAREAGVAMSTVSRMLNNSGPVSSKTRAKIEDAAANLRYIPNAAARSLITNKTRTIGVLLPDLYGEFYSEVIRGLDSAAQSQSYHLLVSSSHDKREEIQAALQTMNGRVDGLIIMSPDISTRSLGLQIPDRLPVVFLNCALSSTNRDSIRLDNFDAAQRMTAHLIGLGHRRIAIVNGDLKNHDAAERLRGYRFALKSAKIDNDKKIEAEGDFSELSGYRAANKLLDTTDNRPTAIFCSNDSMAVGAMSAIRELGLRIPSDVAIAGFDDVPIARYMDPPLTSVHVPLSDMGALSIKLLLGAVDTGERHRSRQEVVKANLIIRSSCGSTVDPPTN